MEKIHIGIVQIATKKLDLEHNFNQSIKLIRKVANKGAKIICTCECMLDGYAFDTKEFRNHPEKYSLPIDHPYIRQYLDLAQELEVFLLIGLSLIEEKKGTKLFRNAILIIDPKLGIIGQYNKVHSTYGNFEAEFYTHGTEFPVFNLQISGETRVTIGIMICYDRQMPETARILAIKGAEIIFNPAATGNFRRGWNTRLIQTRSYENKCYVCSVNHAAPRINGRSLVTDPNGKIIARCVPWETVKVIRVDLKNVYEKRRDLETRRPSVYQDLLKSTKTNEMSANL